MNQMTIRALNKSQLVETMRGKKNKRKTTKISKKNKMESSKRKKNKESKNDFSQI